MVESERERERLCFLAFFFFSFFFFFLMLPDNFLSVKTLPCDLGRVRRLLNGKLAYLKMSGRSWTGKPAQWLLEKQKKKENEKRKPSCWARCCRETSLWKMAVTFRMILCREVISPHQNTLLRFDVWSVIFVTAVVVTVLRWRPGILHTFVKTA